MKKIILSFLAIIALTFVAQAQTEKGSMFIGGVIGFNNDTPEGGSADSGFEAAPRFGYFVANNFAIGVGVGFQTSKVNNGPDDISSLNGFFVNPFARYYVPTAGENFKFFAELGVTYAELRSKDEVGGITLSEGSVSALGLNLSPNFAFFPASNWAIEFGIRGLYYDSINPEGDNNNTTSFGLDVRSLAPQIGINFFF